MRSMPGRSCWTARPQPSKVQKNVAAGRAVQDSGENRAGLTESQVSLHTSVAGAGIAIACGASSAGLDDAKMQAWSIASGKKPANLAIQRRQASRPLPRERQEVRTDHLAMPGDPQAVGKRCRHAIDVVGPGFVAVQGGDVPKQGERLGRRHRV